MHIDHRFTTANEDPYKNLTFQPRSSSIKNPDGSVIFSMENVMVPKSWSQVATDIIAQKYFRKAGIPVVLKKIPETGIPTWLQRSEPDTAALNKRPEEQRFQSETLRR